jgi:hypothetical protein
MQMEERMRVSVRLDFEAWMSEDPETPELLWEKLDEFFVFRGINPNKEFVSAMKERERMDAAWDAEGLDLGMFIEGYE